MLEDDFDGCERCGRYGVVRWSYRGDTLVFQVQVWQPGTAHLACGCEHETREVEPAASTLVAPEPSRLPMNLTGWFVQFTAKRWVADYDNQAVAVSKSTGTAPNIITFPTGVSTGLVQVSVGPLNTITLGDGQTHLVYDVIAIDPSGNKHTLEAGTWEIEPGVTRATTPS